MEHSIDVLITRLPENISETNHNFKYWCILNIYSHYQTTKKQFPEISFTILPQFPH